MDEVSKLLLSGFQVGCFGGASAIEVNVAAVWVENLAGGVGCTGRRGKDHGVGNFLHGGCS